MNKIKAEMEGDVGVKIEYIKITHYIEPCATVTDCWAKIGMDFFRHATLTSPLAK